MLPTTGGHDVASILAAPIPPTITSQVAGNAPVELKELAIKWYDILSLKGTYNRQIRKRLDIREVSLDIEGEGSGLGHSFPKQVRVVCEVDVLPGACQFQMYVCLRCWLLIYSH